MKLRQKLAMVLAAAMIVTAVPVVTMAASQNGYNQTITVAKGDVLDAATDLALELKLDNGDSIKNKTFYVKATDFEFVDADGKKLNDYTGNTANGVPVSVKVSSKTELAVTIGEGSAQEAATGKITLPIYGKVTGEAPTMTVDGEGTILSSGKYPIMADQVASDKKIVASVGKTTNISIDGVGKIADIKIEEVTKGKLSGQKVTVELDNSDLTFKKPADGKIAFKGERGLAGAENSADNYIKVVDIQDETIVLEFVGFKNMDRGSVVITGLEVESNVRGDVATGEVKATITADGEKTMDKVVETVAVVSEYDVKLSVKDDKPVEYIAGGAPKKVEVSLEELAAGSLTAKDRVYFTVEGADITKIGDIAINDWNSKTSQILLGEEAGHEAVLTYDKDAEEFMLDLSKIDEEVISKYTMELTLAAQPGRTEDIKVKAESKAFDDKEVVVGTVKADRTIEVNTVNVKVGQKGQKGGSIVLTENEEQTFKKGDVLFASLEEEALEDGVRIKDFQAEATNGMKVEKVDAYYVVDAKGNTTEELTTVKAGNKKADNVVAVKVLKDSTEAGTITLKDFVVDTNNTTPDGTYKVVLTGTLVSHKDVAGKLEKEFVVVGEQKVEGEAVFKVGEKSFIHNGKTVEMDVAPYISAKNRVMIPLRFVSEAFGIEAKDIMFDQPTGTVTMFMEGKTVQLVNGQAFVLVNGVKIPMEEQMTIKEDRTFLPIGELARILDIEVEWNNETKTVTFTN